jgi:GntP family gluconate:H+ symporter
LAVVGNFGIASDLGIVILVGLLISVPVTLWVYVLASRLGKRIQITLPDKSESAEISKQLPHLFHAFLPIVVPILFLAIASFTDNKLLEVPEMLQKTLHFLGTPLVALLIGVGLASTLVPRRQKSNLVAWLREGAEQAGPILILVGAGGAFGALLAETPLKTMVSEWVLANQFSGVWFLWVAFLIGMFFKTAQGSTTSSMALTSAILAPLLASVGFDTPFELALLLSAVGAGAMAVSHTNDAYFWVISQFSGFSLRQGYQGITVLTLFQGLFTMLVVSVLYFLMI